MLALVSFVVGRERRETYSVHLETLARTPARVLGLAMPTRQRRRNKRRVLAFSVFGVGAGRSGAYLLLTV